MAIKVSGTSVINDSRRLENIASVDSTTAASMTAAGVGGTPSGTNTFDSPVKGDGSGGLRFAGYKLAGGAKYESGSGNYTVPSGTSYVKVWVTGGGGGGGGASASSQQWWSSGGGGASSTITGFIAVNTGDTLAYSVGSKGNKGVGQNNGSNGGNSTLTKGSTTLTANGGSGNTGRYPAPQGGAAGSTSVTGSLLLSSEIIAGSAGDPSQSTFTGGDGGASFYGIGSPGESNNDCQPAAWFGAGGGGTGNSTNASRSGGNGGGGYIVIENWSALE